MKRACENSATPRHFIMARTDLLKDAVDNGALEDLGHARPVDGDGVEYLHGRSDELLHNGVAFEASVDTGRLRLCKA